MKPQGKPLSEYALTELQEIIDFIIEKHGLAKKNKDHGEVRHWKEKYKEVVAHYHTRSPGIWQKYLYD
jgi:hypothetical protein